MDWTLGLTSLYSVNAETVEKLVGIIKTNSVKIEGRHPSTHGPMLGLYPTYSLTNHDCFACNTRTSKIWLNNGVGVGCINLEYNEIWTCH